MSPRRKEDHGPSASQMFFDRDDPDGIARELGLDGEPIERVAKPESTAFRDSLRIFIERAEADPDGAITYVRQRAFGVRQAAQAANTMDSSTPAKIECFTDLLWHATLEGIVGSMHSTSTDKARTRRIAGDVATCLDRCLVALTAPTDLNMARKALMDAEACF